MYLIILVWLLVIVALVAYTAISEIRSQDCVVSCENQAPSPSPGDSSAVLKAKIDKGTRVLYETVDWRRAFLIGMTVVLLILVIWTIVGWPLNYLQAGKVAPRGIDVTIAVITVFLFSYIGIYTLEEIFWKPIAVQIREAASYL